MLVGWFLLAVLGWLALGIAVLIWRHGACLARLWREPVLACPVLIVESDDWGMGPSEDSERLNRIAGVLTRIRDKTGQPAVMTLGVVLGDADGPAIAASNYARYARRTLEAPEAAPIVEAMKAGGNLGVFALQRHGLEHFWPPSLMFRLRHESAGGVLRTWLANPRHRSESLPADLQSRWVDTATLPSAPLAAAGVAAAVEDEVALYERVFGFCPKVAVPNTFIWNEVVEAAWAATGVTCIVTPGAQFAGRDRRGNLLPACRKVWNGMMARSGAVYVVRDDYFEPVRGHRAERVWQAVADKTRLGRPALLETHRESFIGAAQELEAALAELETALTGALARFPGMRFLSTEALAASYADDASPLRDTRPLCRVRAFTARICAEPECRRMLKMTMLAPVLGGLESLLATVSGARPASG